MKHLATAFILAATFSMAADAKDSPLVPLSIARQGYFFVGGKYSTVKDQQVMSGQLYVEFQIPGTHSAIQGIGTFEARQLSGRRVVIRIRLDISPDWAPKEPITFRIPSDGCRQIELHPNQSVARYRMFAA